MPDGAPRAPLGPWGTQETPQGLREGRCSMHAKFQLISLVPDQFRDISPDFGMGFWVSDWDSGSWTGIWGVGLVFGVLDWDSGSSIGIWRLP